eukprot:3992862-Pyramimonas_sp.AAC.1
MMSRNSPSSWASYGAVWAWAAVGGPLGPLAGSCRGSPDSLPRDGLGPRRRPRSRGPAGPSLTLAGARRPPPARAASTPRGARAQG